jgi:hypothetical protein
MATAVAPAANKYMAAATDLIGVVIGCQQLCSTSTHDMLHVGICSRLELCFAADFGGEVDVLPLASSWQRSKCVGSAANGFGADTDRL